MWKTRVGKSHNNRDVILFEKFRFEDAFVHTKTKRQRFQIPPCLKSVFVKLCFRDGLVWTVGPYHGNKAVFSNLFGVTC